MAYEIRAQIDAVRLELESCKSEHDSVSRLPMATEEVAAAVEDWVSKRAASWRPPIDAFTAPGGGRRDFTLVLPHLFGHREGGASSSSEAEAAACALFGDRVRAVLLERCAAHLKEHGSGLPAEKRQVKLAHLDARIRELEGREEALIVAAEEEGFDLDRRSDADVFVVFGIVTDSTDPAPEGDMRVTGRRVRSPDATGGAGGAAPPPEVA